MPNSTLSLITSAIHQRLEALARLLGVSEAQTRDAAELALSTLWQAIRRSTTAPAEASRIHHTLDQYDGGLLNALDNAMLRGGRPLHRLLVRGNSLLHLVSKGSPAALVDEVATRHSLPVRTAEALMGLIAMIAFSTLGVYRREQELDAGGLAKLIHSEEDRGSSHSETTTTPCSASSDLDQDAPSAAMSNSPEPASATRQSRVSHLIKTLLPLVLLGVIAYLGYQSAIRRASRPNLPTIQIPGFDTAQFHDRIAAVTEAVGSIHDEESATEAVAVIQESESFLDQYDFGAIASTSEAEAAGKFFLQRVGPLRQKVETAYAIPGVAEVLEPAIKPFLARFTHFE